MIPNKTLAALAAKAEYLFPDDRPTSPLISYEMGGAGIQDATQGLRVQVWTLESNYYGAYLSAPNTPAYRLFDASQIDAYRGTTNSTITEVSLAFTQLMQPFAAFVAGKMAGYYWFDSVSHKYTFSDLPPDAEQHPVLTPRCCLDDKRPRETGNSDIILAYVRDNVLYFRAERDRYTVEYTLLTQAPFTLDQVGMNEKGRLQFRVRLP